MSTSKPLTELTALLSGNSPKALQMQDAYAQIFAAVVTTAPPNVPPEAVSASTDWLFMECYERIKG